MDIGVPDRFADGAGLTECGEVTEDVAGSGSAGSNSLLSGSDQSGIERTGLSETGTDLAFEITTDPRGLTGILGTTRHANALVGRRGDGFLGDGATADVLEELRVESRLGCGAVTLRVKSLKLGSALLGELGAVLLSGFKLALSLHWSQISQRLTDRFGLSDVGNVLEVNLSKLTGLLAVFVDRNPNLGTYARCRLDLTLERKSLDGGHDGLAVRRRYIWCFIGAAHRKSFGSSVVWSTCQNRTNGKCLCGTHPAW